MERSRSDAPARTLPVGGTGWLVLALVCAGQFMVVLDVSIVNVALPAIQADLGFTGTTLAWVIDAYALTFAGVLLLGGRAADVFGHRRTFVAGLVLFSAASLAGGLATGPVVLVAARALQGVGAATLSPATMTILTTAFPEGPRRAKALAAWSAVGAAGGAAGSILGGVLTAGLSWRWILLINVPVGLAVLAGAVAVLARDHDRAGATRLDVPGSVTVSAGLAAVVYGTIQSGGHGWSSSGTLVPLIAGLVLLAVFVLLQAKPGRGSLVPLRIFRSRSVAGAAAVILLTGVPGFAMWYFVSLYLQEVLHYGPLRAGLSFLPHTAALVVAARSAPRLLARFGVRPLIVAGALGSAVGFGWQAQAMTHSGGFVAGVLLPGVLMAAGMGLTFTPVAVAATSGVPRVEAGLVSGVVTTARQIGGTIGLAVLATAAGARTAALHARPRAESLAAGYGRAFLLGAVFMIAAAAAVALLPSRDNPPKEITMSSDTFPRLSDLPHAEGVPPRSSWGLFGADDELGTLNLMTDQRVLAARDCIRTGKRFTLNLPIDQPSHPFFGRPLPGHEVLTITPTMLDDRLTDFSPQGSTQWDALAHVGHSAGFYNGHTLDDVRAGKLGIHHVARRGVAGRGVLLDVARHVAETTGSAIDQGTAFEITADLLTETARRQHTELRAGDVLCVRTGWLAWYLRLTDEERAEMARLSFTPDRLRMPGLSPAPAMVEFLWDHGVAGLATDTMAVEVVPTPADPDATLHSQAIGLLGMTLGELFDFEELAADSAEDAVHEFFFTSVPLRIPGGIGSPANALAVK